MKGVGRQLHPKILRFGSRFSPASTPIATPASADSDAGPEAQRARQTVGDAGHNIRRVFFDELYIQESRSARQSNRADVPHARELEGLFHGLAAESLKKRG